MFVDNNSILPLEKEISNVKPITVDVEIRTSMILNSIVYQTWLTIATFIFSYIWKHIIKENKFRVYNTP